MKIFIDQEMFFFKKIAHTNTFYISQFINIEFNRRQNVKQAYQTLIKKTYCREKFYINLILA